MHVTVPAFLSTVRAHALTQLRLGSHCTHVASVISRLELCLEPVLALNSSPEGLHAVYMRACENGRPVQNEGVVVDGLGLRFTVRVYC